MSKFSVKTKIQMSTHIHCKAVLCSAASVHPDLAMVHNDSRQQAPPRGSTHVLPRFLLPVSWDQQNSPFWGRCPCSTVLGWAPSKLGRALKVTGGEDVRSPWVHTSFVVTSHLDVLEETGIISANPLKHVEVVILHVIDDGEDCIRHHAGRCPRKI